MPTSLSTRQETTVLPSLPPSPSLLDEIFSQRQSWSFRPDPQGSRPSSSGSAGSPTRGRGKQPSEDDQQRAGTHKAYPPMTDEAAETRRVEETLRGWELAERQRRRSLRESVQYTSGPSLLSSVKRTANLVLRRSGSTSGSVGPNARAFKSHDVARKGYVLPLDDMDISAVTVHSPTPSSFGRGTSLDTGTRVASRTSDNPFVHPEDTPARLLTPVTPTRTHTLTPSSPPSPSPFSDARGKRSSGSSESFIQPPPSSEMFTPSFDKQCVAPPQPMSQPVLRPPRREDAEEKQEVRWWHDWLCGCGEGSDRGGDNQAGRTNPFE